MADVAIVALRKILHEGHILPVGTELKLAEEHALKLIEEGAAELHKVESKRSAAHKASSKPHGDAEGE